MHEGRSAVHVQLEEKEENMDVSVCKLLVNVDSDIQRKIQFNIKNMLIKRKGFYYAWMENLKSETMEKWRQK